MDKYIYDENNSLCLWYELQGDYYIPCLMIPEEEQQSIGMRGRRHLRYIREYRQGLYNSLLRKMVLPKRSKQKIRCYGCSG